MNPQPFTTEEIETYFEAPFRNGGYRNKIETIIGRPVTLDVTRYQQTGYRFLLTDSGAKDMYTNQPLAIADGYLTPMSGCCGLIIAHNALTTHKYQKRGIGTLLNLYRLDVARVLGYGTVICTDKRNSFNQKILAKNGWRKVHEFVNPRTDNSVDTFVFKVK